MMNNNNTTAINYENSENSKISITDNLMPSFNGLTADMVLFFEQRWDSIKNSDDERIKKSLSIGRSRILAWKTVFEMILINASTEIAKGKAHLSPDMKDVMKSLDLGNTPFGDSYSASINVIPFLTVSFIRSFDIGGPTYTVFKDDTVIQKSNLNKLQEFAMQIAAIWMTNGKTSFYQDIYTDMLEIILFQFLVDDDTEIL